jgi:type IV pilus assembly protein PilA
MIELLLVIGIVSLLALMSIPGLLEKTARDQVISALSIADIAKAPIAASWAATQTFPNNNAAAALPPADKIVGNYVSAVEVIDGTINITFGNSVSGALKGKVLTLRPAVVTDAPIVPVSWICAAGSVPAKMTVIGANRTSVAPPYLPAACRG